MYSRILLALCFCTSLWARPNVAIKDAEFPPPWSRPALIQVVLVVDTGFNASGLIRQTQADLYDVINELLLSRKNDQQPIVQVAVITAGNGQVRLLNQFTSHYDAIMSQMALMRSGHGKTRINEILMTALEQLQWSPYAQDVKCLFVVGQGRLRRSANDFIQTGLLAAEKGVTIHALYAGPYKLGIHDGWAEMAYSTGGRYGQFKASVTASRTTTPLDALLNKARQALLETYRQQGDPWQNQWEAHKTKDRQALLISRETALQRIIAQALKEYDPDHLQALHLEGLDNTELKRQIDMRTDTSLNTVHAITDYETQIQVRHELYAQIIDLASQRRAALSSQIFSSKTPSLAFAMIRILHEQLPQRGFDMPQ